MLLTVCTIRQLPRAFALCYSYSQVNASQVSEPVLIGLVDDPDHLPADFASPFPLLPIADLLPADQLQALSTVYTPTEFAAACKPLFIAEAFRRYPSTDSVLYADPSIQFFTSIPQSVETQFKPTVVLTPFITQSPASTSSINNAWPDEKYFQNIGLYTADFLLFNRSDETDRMLAWWDNRVRKRAYIDACAGLCLDQIWLMHVPVFFRNVVINKNPGWHVGLWNLSERTIRPNGDDWLVDGPFGQRQPLVFINFKGLWNPDEGFFPHQNRVVPAKRPEVMHLLERYRQDVASYQDAAFATVRPAYGQQPEPIVIRGWRQATIGSLQTVTRFIDRVYLPEVRPKQKK